MKVGMVQFLPELGRVEGNRERAGEFLDECSAREAELVVLPELFDTGYFWAEKLHELIAESFAGTVAWLKERATDHEMTIVAGVGEPAAGNFYDSAILARPSGELKIYRKTHLFRDEVEYFQKGDRLLTAELEGAKLKLGTLICVEVGFPELARALALDGAELIALPMAFGAARRNIYETATRARAIENNLFLITANQVGHSDGFDFYGHSRVVSPLGEVLLDLGTEEGCGVVELDLGLVKRCRRGEVDEAYPYLEERRPELYSRLVDQT